MPDRSQVCCSLFHLEFDLSFLAVILWKDQHAPFSPVEFHHSLLAHL